MKIKLTKNLKGKYQGKAGDIITIDPIHLDSIIRQGAGIALKEPPKPKEEDKKEEKTA